MEKDKVLPVIGDRRVPSIGELVYDAAVAQRDADWEVLQRDYVPRKRIKPLVELVRQAMGHTDDGDDEAHCIYCGAWRHEGHNSHCEALAQLEEEKL